MSDIRTKGEGWFSGLLPGFVAGMVAIGFYFGSYFTMIEQIKVLKTDGSMRLTPIARYHVPFPPGQRLSTETLQWVFPLFEPAHWIDRQVRRTTWQTH